MEQVPPLTSSIGVSCFKCFKDELELELGKSLMKCSACRRVAYCSQACQKTDWSRHKAFCKAFKQVENDPASRALLLFSLADAPSTDMNFLNTMSEESARNEARLTSVAMKRQLNVIDRNLIGWQPRCLACTRTDRIIRMQNATDGTSRKPLTPCPDCRMSFYCSDEHWEAVKDIHFNQPCVDGHDNLTQCQMNQEIRLDVGMALSIQAASNIPTGGFQWAPERIKSSWTPVSGSNYEFEFLVELKKSLRLPATAPTSPWVRAASDGLSMPMTIMHALEKFNDSDSWTRKDILTIHIIGSAQMEILAGQVFEEILHRLPQVQVLKLLLCGPDISGFLTSGYTSSLDMETCPACQRTGRKRVHQLCADTYHGFSKKLRSQYTKPDLVVAFNSGLSQESMATWPETLKFLVENHIPSIFTSYNREEAYEEHEVLRKAGAAFIPELGPKENPWGSLLAKTEPNKVYGFYRVNGWLSGGFR